jgi:hypothetical protein
VSQAPLAALGGLIAEQKRISFRPEFVARVSNAEALGILVAHWAQWNGEEIVAAFLAALEDANFHSFGQALAKAWAAEQERVAG